ncbi:MAG: ABC transporter ATP-binding protein [Pseudomonadota bacterium]
MLQETQGQGTGEVPLDGAPPLLSVEGLSVAFGYGRAAREVVHGVGFTLEKGETLALVGESGSGKTLTGKAVMGLLPHGAAVTGGKAVFNPAGKPDARPFDLLQASRSKLRKLRGTEISMIFQEPLSSFSPLHRTGPQIAEVLEIHGVGGRKAKERTLKTLAEVGCPDPGRVWRAYPFELSGGLRQRAMIAMAMVGEPTLVIADEPTTALDVTTQAVVLDLLKGLSKSRGLATILITHDLGVVANMADSVVVLRQGAVVESGPAQAVLEAPGHAYTRRLIAAAPRLPEQCAEHDAPGNDFILRIDGLSKTYPGKKRSFGPDDPPVRALSDFALDLERGETVAVVGESGSGKSTVAKLALRAIEPDPGAVIRFRARFGEEVDVTALGAAGLKEFRRQAQMVFQDPYGALSPRMSVQDILTEPMAIHSLGNGRQRRQEAARIMERVGLSADHLGRFPHAFSGGQRQRIAIARALILEPELLICDEPTSALDVSVQAEVLDLLDQLKADFGLSYLFISHDLAVVARLADRVMVMRRGRVVEQGPAEAIFRDPRHPYTRALMAASPEPDVDAKLDLKLVAAGAGEPEEWPDPFRYEGDNAPGLVTVGPGHEVRCAA